MGDVDALVTGAGPAGSAVAIGLACAGWRVLLVEQHAFPRQKVCGECVSAGSLQLLDELGVGAALARIAGPELRQVGWMGAAGMVVADFPRCDVGGHGFGRAVGRDLLDELLLERARAAGVEVLQPARVRRLRGAPGDFECGLSGERVRRARVVIDAHGSWEAGPDGSAIDPAHGPAKRLPAATDLFAFKARYQGAALAPGVLPVIAFPGGYGGIVVADAGHTTLACCIRRDALKSCRAAMPGVAAGDAVAAYLRASCGAVEAAVGGAQRQSAWLSVGPIRPGVRVDAGAHVFRVGNAAGETHPLIGEGIAMALQSARLLVRHLTAQAPGSLDATRTREVNRRYAAAWRAAFVPRLRFARAYAHATMRAELHAPAHSLFKRWPSLLTRAARWAGKAALAPQFRPVVDR